MPEGDTPPPPGTPPPTPTPPPAPPASDPNEGWKNLLAKHQNDALKVAQDLYSDNHKLRARNRELKTKVTPEGALVLSADEAKAWNDYRALGKPEELKAVKDEHPKLRDELSGIRTADVHRRAAEACGFNEPVLSRLAAQDKIEIEVKEETVGGKPKPVAYARVAGDDGKPKQVLLTDYVKQAWAPFLPSLSISSSSGPPPGTPRRPDPAGAPPPPIEKPRSLYGAANPY